MPRWAMLSLISAISFALGDFLVVKVTNQGVIGEQGVFAAYMILCAVAITIYLWWSKNISLDYLRSLSNSQTLTNLSVISVLMLVAYYSHYLALTGAPNPGYANSLIVLHVIFLSILSYYFLDKPLDRARVLGILLTITGAIIVTLPPNAFRSHSQ